MLLRPTRTFSPIRLIAGWCGLLFYVGAFSPIGMVAVALLGTIDPDHHAFFQPGANGMRLVLHHEGNCATHKHHGVARALTLFAQPASDTDPDHVVQFASGDGIWSESSKMLSGEGAESERHFASDDISFNHARLFQLECPSTGPPPDIVGNLLSVRFTVLLI